MFRPRPIGNCKSTIGNRLTDPLPRGVLTSSPNIDSVRLAGVKISSADENQINHEERKHER